MTGRVAPLGLERFKAGIQAISDSYRAEFSKETMLNWYALLQPLGDERFGLAVEEFCRSVERLPMHCNVAAMLLRIAEAAAEAGTPTAEEAYAEAMAQARFVGRWGRPSFSHPAVAETVEAVGWASVCGSQEGDSVFRAHFVRAYQGVRWRRRGAPALGDGRAALPARSPGEGVG